MRIPLNSLSIYKRLNWVSRVFFFLQQTGMSCGVLLFHQRELWVEVYSDYFAKYSDKLQIKATLKYSDLVIVIRHCYFIIFIPLLPPLMGPLLT